MDALAVAFFQSDPIPTSGEPIEHRSAGEPRADGTIDKFDDLPPAERDALAAVKTRLSLPADETERLISGGRTATHANRALQLLSGGSGL